MGSGSPIDCSSADDASTAARADASNGSDARARPAATAVDTLRRFALGTETWTSERCHIVEMSNGSHDPALSIARARVEPGVTTRWHHLIDTTERYVIIEGRALVEIGTALPETIGPGDVVLIAPMIRQRITNAGTKDLVFLALCTPRFEHRNYVEHDERPG